MEAQNNCLRLERGLLRGAPFFRVAGNPNSIEGRVLAKPFLAEKRLVGLGIFHSEKGGSRYGGKVNLSKRDNLFQQEKRRRTSSAAEERQKGKSIARCGVKKKRDFAGSGLKG